MTRPLYLNLTQFVRLPRLRVVNSYKSNPRWLTPAMVFLARPIWYHHVGVVDPVLVCLFSVPVGRRLWNSGWCFLHRPIYIYPTLAPLIIFFTITLNMCLQLSKFFIFRLVMASVSKKIRDFLTKLIRNIESSLISLLILIWFNSSLTWDFVIIFSQVCDL